MKKLGVELLLIALCATMSLSFLISYVVAVSNQHVAKPYLPYISQVGSTAPERCIFTLGLNIAAIIGVVIIFVRFKHVHYLYTNTVSGPDCLNKFSAVVGVLSFIGALLVASFQDKVLFPIHLTGAFMAFLFGTIYMWLQTLLSFKISRSQLSQQVGRWLLLLRLFLSALATLFCLSTAIMGLLAGRFLKDFNPDEHHIFHWVSTISEWGISASFLLFLLTFHSDFVAVSMRIKVGARVRQESIIVGRFDDDKVLTL